MSSNPKLALVLTVLISVIYYLRKGRVAEVADRPSHLNMLLDDGGLVSYNFTFDLFDLLFSTAFG